MHKLTNVESQRMMAVMGDLLDRLNYLTYVPSGSHKELLNILHENRCEGIADTILEQWRWEQLYLQTLESMDARTEEIGEQVKLTTKILCRGFKENPIAVEMLYQFATTSNQDRSEDSLMLVKTLSELTDLIQNALEKTVEDSKSKKDLMSIAESRMKQAEDERQLIKEKLNELRKTKEEEVSLLDTQVQKLKNELHSINQAASQELNAIESELKDSQNRAFDQHNAEMNLLRERAFTITSQIGKMTEDHREEEDTFRKKKCKAAAEVASIVEKYDSEMIAMDTEMRSLQETHRQELLKCQELEEHFQKIDEEQARIAEEERQLEEIRAKEREKQMFIFVSATMIQKIWRGVLARREYAKIQSKNKKGKKKAKK